MRSWPRRIAQRWFHANSGRRSGVRWRTIGLRTSTSHTRTTCVPSPTAVSVQMPLPTKSPSIRDTSLRGATASTQISSHRRRYGNRPRVRSRARFPGAAGPSSPSPWRKASPHQVRVLPWAGQELVHPLRGSGNEPFVDEAVA